MSTITVLVSVSEAGRQAEALAGNAGPKERQVISDLAELSQRQRDVLVPVAWIDPQDGSAKLTLNSNFAGIPALVLRDEPGYGYGDERGARAEHWVEKHAPEFDAQPTIEQIVAEVERLLAANAQVQTQAEDRAHPYAEAYTAKQQAQAESDTRHAQEYARMRPLLDTLIAAGDYEAVNVASTVPGSVGRPDWYDWSFCPSRGQSLSALQNEACTAIRKERAEIEKARAEAEKAAWIEAHGSEYLRRACIEHDYDCQRRYVSERAALEAPGYTVDFHDRAEWKSRSCPTEAALDELDAAESLGIGIPDVVWLTEDAQPERSADEYPEPFEPCEAVVIRGYLGKYDLIKI